MSSRCLIDVEEVCHAPETSAKCVQWGEGYRCTLTVGGKLVSVVDVADPIVWCAAQNVTAPVGKRPNPAGPNNANDYFGV
jgi:hypothetical protein